MTNQLMPKWKKDATEFIVKVGHHETRGEQIYIPKPIVEFLKEPDAIKFTIKGKKIEISPEK
ncbi:hypothetical protein LBMAG54_05310 [Nitrosopumilaceae archaeon]|nr:hypothetical protein EMGBD3_00850 [Nitrosarchaeum sp.]GDY15675.1 hypothetical protein LBMAG54_05310 [Nitrosopumilaceae archaeon]